MGFGIVGGVLVVLFALYCFFVCPRRADAVKKAPFQGLMAAHRGLYEKDQSIPENSLEAFRRAAENGYGVELDVQLTRDGEVVVFHDDTVDRMTENKGRVDGFTLAELEAMPLKGTEHRVPLFTDVMAVLDGVSPTIVELKSTENYPELCEKTLAILRTLQGPFCVESFDPRIVRWFYKNAPDLIRGQLTESFRYWRKAGAPLHKALLMHTLCVNFLTHPQFIAFGRGRRPLCWFLARPAGAMTVFWTERPDSDHGTLQKRYDCRIFEHYRPETRYERKS
ncbi:MAG: glycerophosphodiester phosphodiesterase [Clostridia bacterium]|nr:glycerophosphodiester phosphodiesterase [Clostridia bacterium]